MAQYVYLLGNYDGTLIGELPFTPTDRYSRQLTGCGSASGTIPLDHPMSSEANFINGLRNLIILRNDVVDWWGPIVAPVPDLDSRTLTLNAREPTWWFGKRAVEVNKHYNADINYIFRKLWTYAVTKTDGGSINAPLNNITISAGNAGITKRLVLAGPARHLLVDCYAFLTDDPDTGLEYRVDFSSASRQAASAVITLGAPLGATKTHLLTEHVLINYGRAPDHDRSGTRAHVVGSGTTSTKQNTGSVSAGWPLMDVVLDRSDTSDSTLIDNVTRELRRKAQPPVQVFDVEFTPDGNALPFNFCNLGDKVNIDIGSPGMLSINNSSRRVVEIAVMPQTDAAAENVGLMLNLPADSLGV